MNTCRSRWTLRSTSTAWSHRSAAAALDLGRGGRRPGGPGAAHGQERQVLGSSRDAMVRSTCPSKTRRTLCRFTQIVRVRPATPCRTVTALPPCHHCHVAAGRNPGLELHRRAARNRGRRRGRSPRCPATAQPRPGIWSAFAVGMVIWRDEPCGRNLLAGVAISSAWCGL